MFPETTIYVCLRRLLNISNDRNIFIGNGERTQNPVRSFPTKILTTSVYYRKTDLVSEKRAGYRIIKDTIEMKKTSRSCEGTAGFYIRTFLVGALEYN